MIKSIIAFILLSLASPAVAQSMSGLTLGQQIAGGLVPGSFVSQQEIGTYTARKWKLTNGDDLSATVDRSGRIVYIEQDSVDGRIKPSPYSPFWFGQTTLGQIRETFGSNGYVYRDHMGFPMSDGSLALFNTYELRGHPDMTRTFVTLAKPTRNDEKSVGASIARGTLMSTIMATTAYLSEAWGESIRPDEGYQPIPAQ